MEHFGEREHIGAVLQFVRSQRGLSQEELADALGISRPYLANIEMGRRTLNPRLAQKASETLAVRPIVFFNENFLKKDIT